MAQGLIKVAYSTRKVEKENRSSVGIVTIKSLKEATPLFTVLSVCDTSTGENLSVTEATEKGLLNVEKNFVVDSKAGKKYTIHEAAGRNLVTAQKTGDAPQSEEVVKRSGICFFYLGCCYCHVIYFIDLFSIK